MDIAGYKSKCSYHEKMYARERSHTAHPLYALLVSHTITVQGIRNDDQSLSPVTPLVPLLFLSFLIPKYAYKSSIINK